MLKFGISGRTQSPKFLIFHRRTESALLADWAKACAPTVRSIAHETGIKLKVNVCFSEYSTHMHTTVITSLSQDRKQADANKQNTF